MKAASGDSPGDSPTKMKSMKLARWMISQPTKAMSFSSALVLVMGLGLLPIFGADEAKPDDASKPPVADVGTREELKLPGLTIHTKERYVDVDVTVPTMSFALLLLLQLLLSLLLLWLLLCRERIPRGLLS